MLTRREVLLAAAIAAAAPYVRSAPAARAQEPALMDATLQAFFDTMIPGRRVARTATGQAVHPAAIAGVDPLPGAVEADALLLAHHPLLGFDALAPPFLADLELHAAGSFLDLDWAGRERACVSGFSFDNPLRVVWEAAAAVAFTAFCAAGLSHEQRGDSAPGYRVMGLPGPAPRGYADFSYRRRLARERTRTGSLD
jgi:hypothetical protein